MARSIQHAADFLSSGTLSSGFLAAVRRDAELLTAVRRSLPAPLDRHCLHTTVDKGILILTTDSPSWASRLRFLAPELLKELAGGKVSVESCRIRVQPVAGPGGASQGKRSEARLSPAAANHLREAATGMDDPELAEAFRRLAEAGGKRG
jgi:hypothetical protein